MKTTFIFLLSIFTIHGFSQDFKYGKVSVEELKKEKSMIDADAAGEILYEKAEIRLELSTTENRFYITEEVEGRIKVYDKDNLSSRFLNKKVRVYSPNSTREKITSFKGSTYNLENGKAVETKVKGSDIFKEKENKYYESEKFAFPNVQNGSVLEYKYTVVSPFYQEIERWYFQQEIPIEHSEFTFIRPEFFVYSPDERGGLRGKVNQTRKAAMGMNFHNTITEYVFQNVKPLKKEPFVFNLNNLKSSIRFELMKFEHPGFLTENYSTTWAAIGKDLMNHSEFGGQLKGNGFLDETVKNLTSGLSSPKEKMQAIFNFVKSNYSWNNYSGLGSDTGVKSTFKDKTGNVADLNLMLVSMLQKAGLNANPVVLSTVQNLMVNYTFPSVTSLDFVIAAVEINNGLYLMDATEKYSDINMLPLRDLNHRGFRIMDNGTVQEIQLTNYALSTEKEVINVSLSEDGKVSGVFTETKDKYFAMTDKMSQVEDPKGFDKNYLEQFNFDVEQYKIDENAEKGLLRYSFKFTDIPVGESISNKLILNPMLFTQLKESSFTQDNRNYPLEFGSLISKSKIIKIKIPEGYKVESLPSEKQFVVDGNVAGYVYKIEEKDGHIILNSVYEIAHSVLPANYYELMKDFESKQINAESQEIVLVKI